MKREMKLFFIKGQDGYDECDPILVLADTKEEAEKLAKGKQKDYSYWFPENIFEDNSPDEFGKAGEGYKLKKGVIWKQFNAG